MRRIARIFRHLFWPAWRVRRHFDAAALTAIRNAIADGETRHDGELRFAAEGGLPWSYLARNAAPRERALMAFAKLGVWDTAANTGVLIYVGLADRDVEIVADRGVAHAVGAARWQAICTAMEQRFAAGDWHGGALEGIAAIHDALAKVAPPRAGKGNEVPDRPVLL